MTVLAQLQQQSFLPPTMGTRETGRHPGHAYGVARVFSRTTSPSHCECFGTRHWCTKQHRARRQGFLGLKGLRVRGLGGQSNLVSPVAAKMVHQTPVPLSSSSRSRHRASSTFQMQQSTSTQPQSASLGTARFCCFVPSSRHANRVAGEHGTGRCA